MTDPDECTAPFADGFDYWNCDCEDCRQLQDEEKERNGGAGQPEYHGH